MQWALHLLEVGDKYVKRLKDTKRELGFIFVDLCCNEAAMPEFQTLHEILCWATSYQACFVFILTQLDNFKKVCEAADSASLQKITTIHYATKSKWTDASGVFSNIMNIGLLCSINKAKVSVRFCIRIYCLYVVLTCGVLLMSCYRWCRRSQPGFLSGAISSCNRLAREPRSHWTTWWTV